MTDSPEPPIATRIWGMGLGAAPYRLPIYLGCTLLALVCNYVLGKDLAWDTLNYHLYAGFSALTDRFAQDYFAAGPQSYLNPFAYVPFYVLVRAGLPALMIGSILALVHSTILWLTYELGAAVCPTDSSRARVLTGVCAVALAFMNPIMIQQIGSCFADITTAELALGGWVLLASAVRTPRLSRVVCAGMILGVATALKLTNAVHAIAALAMLTMLPLTHRARIRYVLLYGTALVFGFAITAAAWSYRLEQIFGNPMFPLMNNIFHSPEFTDAPLRHFRFIPETLGEALWRPFAIVSPLRMVHEEFRAPDLRYAVLLVLSVILFLRWIWRVRGADSTASTAAGPTASTRVLAALGLGFGADWTLWLGGSGNSRYFLPMANVAAVIIVGLLFRLLATRPKTRNYLLAAIFVLQALQLLIDAEFRWNGVPWGGKWFDVEIPDRLKKEPNLYLTVGSQSNSFIAPFLARGSGLVNFSGGYALGPEGPGGARIKALILRYAPHLRVVISGAKLYDDVEGRAPRRSQVDDALQRFGLRTDLSDCVTIVVHGLPPDLEIRYKTSVPVEPVSQDTTYMVSCHLIPDSGDRFALIARQKSVDLVLDRLEAACPKLFQPSHLLTERDGESWQRLYFNTDLAAWVSYGWVKFKNPIRPGDPMVFVGRESDWAKHSLRLDCGRRNGRYFAHLLDSNDEATGKPQAVHEKTKFSN